MATKATLFFLKRRQASWKKLKAGFAIFSVESEPFEPTRVKSLFKFSISTNPF